MLFTNMNYKVSFSYYLIFNRFMSVLVTLGKRTLCDAHHKEHESHLPAFLDISDLMCHTIILSDCLKYLTYLDIASLYMSVVGQNIVPHNCILSTFEPTANMIGANAR